MDVIHARILEAVNQGENLFSVLKPLIRTYHKNPHFLGSAVGTILSCYLTAREAGYTFEQTNPAMAEFMASGRERMLYELTLGIATDDYLVADQLVAMSLAISAWQKAGCSWSLTPQVPKPILVSVANSPTRTIKTEMTRDPETGDLISTVATSTDAV